MHRGYVIIMRKELFKHDNAIDRDTYKYLSSFKSEKVK